MNAIVRIPAAPAITIFRFEDHDIRVVDLAGQPVFVGADVCKAAGLSNPSVSLKALDEDERAKIFLGHPQGEVTVISEGGLYTLLMRSQRAMTKGSLAWRFRKWATGEVLPTIRRTGSYAATPVVLPEPLRDPATLLALIEHQARQTLSARAETQTEREAHSDTHAQLEDEVRLRRIEASRAESNGRALVVAKAKVEELAPLAEGYREVMDAQGGLCVTDVANVLGVPRGRLFAFMRDKGDEDEPREPWLYVRPGQQQEHAYRPRIHRKEMLHRLHFETIMGKREVKPQPIVTMLGIDRLRVEYPPWAAEQERKADRQARLPGIV